MPNRLIIAGLLAAAPAALLAHHGPTLYDANPKNRVTLEGPLKDLKWAWPHISAKIKSQGKTWKLVFPAAQNQASRGITKEMLISAKSVTIVGEPRRDGTPELRASIQAIDGKKV